MIWKIKCPSCNHNIEVDGHSFLYSLITECSTLLDAMEYPNRGVYHEECGACGNLFELNLDITLSVSTGRVLNDDEIP